MYLMYQGKKGDRIIYRQYYQHSSTDTLKQLYMSSVRPHLEYGTAVWDPHLQKDINKLEKVQTFALRMCTKNWTADYDSLFTSCNLPSLKKRHLFLKLSFLYQLVNNLVILLSHNVSHQEARLNTRSASSAQLVRPFCRTETYILSRHNLPLEPSAPISHEVCILSMLLQISLETISVSTL